MKRTRKNGKRKKGKRKKKEKKKKNDERWWIDLGYPADRHALPSCVAEICLIDRYDITHPVRPSFSERSGGIRL